MSMTQLNKGVVGGVVSSIALVGLAEPASATEAMIDSSRAWHGRLMVVAWVVLFPIGIFAARHFKVLPSQKWPQQLDNQIWWHVHQLTQYFGFALICMAVWLIWNASDDPSRSFSAHRWVGWILVVFAIAQVIGGLLRGTKGGPTAPAADGSLFGDHYNMTPRRKTFEAVHKSVGYTAMILAFFTVLSGLYAAAAPLWMWLAIFAWLIVIGSVWVALELRNNPISTYQAIWGPDPVHPGNDEVT